ncbi:tetratricopeptide repeat protein [Tautonia sociabilis]|uniref:tetratricopeptide repeat protein n=1 Tax=Tautonia sociabilis TaxID=2080755 RepID=UPI0013151635|nr:tetratricopeptide repeat protein [Tautonia sociabilis]
MRVEDRSPGREPTGSTPRALLLVALIVLGAAAEGAGQGTANRPIGDGPVPEGLNFANGLFRARRFDLAVQEYDRFLNSAPADSPHRVEAIFGKANAHHFLQEYEEARTAFEEFLRVAPADHPNAPTALYRIGELAYVLGDLPAARRALEAYTSGPPAHRYQDLAWPYLGDVRFREGDLDGAKAAYERALTAFPDGRLADRSRLNLARVLARLGDREGALARFRELIDRPGAEGRDEALDQVARMELEAGRFDRALEAFEALERDVPQSVYAPRARLGKAEALAAMGKPDEAAAVLSALRDDPSAELGARASYQLGMLERDRGRVAEAKAIFDEAIDRFPDTSTTPALRYRAAETVELAGNPAEALARFERLAEAHPNHSWADDALLQAASIALESDQPDRAAELARRARGPQGNGPLAAPALLIEARAALDRGQADEAVGLLQTLLDSSAPDAGTAEAARYYLGLALRASGRQEEAIAQLESLAEAAGSRFSADALYLVGQHRFDEGRFDEAADALARYLDARPDGDVADHALARLALALDAQGRDDEADDALDRLSEGFPSSVVLGPTRLRIAEQAMAEERWDRAESLFRAVAEDEDAEPALRARAWSGLGWSLRGKGRLEEAAEAFALLIDLAPDDPMAEEAGLARGQALRELGKTDEALAAFSWVVEHAPDSGSAPKADLERARLLVDAGRPGEAAAIYSRLVDRGAEGTGAPVDRLLSELGWAWIDSAAESEADRAFSRLLDEHPDSPFAGDARLNLAESAYRRGELDRVVAVLGPLAAEGAEVDPRLRQAALYRMGRTRADLGEWDEAGSLFDRLVSEFPAGLYVREARFWAAEVAFRSGNAQEAEQRFTALIEESPADQEPEPWLATALLRRIQALVQLERWSDVLALADALKAERPDFPQMAELDYARGRALQGKAPPQFDEARRAYQAVIDARKGGELAAMAQFMRGETYFHEKNYDEAIREFLRVVYLPSYNDARKWQALSLLEAGKAFEQLDRWADAADLYEELRSQFPDEPASEEAARRLAVARRRASDGAVGPGSPPGRRG